MRSRNKSHYSDVISTAITSQNTSLTIIYATVDSGADQWKHQSSAPLAYVWGIHRWPVNSLHKGPVTWKMFPFDDFIMRNLLMYLRVYSPQNRRCKWARNHDEHKYVHNEIFSGERIIPSPSEEIHKSEACHYQPCNNNKSDRPSEPPPLSRLRVGNGKPDITANVKYTLRWRHNDGDSVSNHQPYDCLLSCLFGRTSKKTSKLRVTGLCVGNSPGTGEFPA